MEKPDVTSPWRKATYSSSNGGSCVEVASTVRTIMIRDTKQDHLGSARTVLSVPAAAWTTFTDSLN